MPPDLSFTSGMTDQGYKAAIDRMLNDTKRFKGAWDAVGKAARSAIVIGAVSRGIGMASGMVSDYAEDNARARAEVERFSASIDVLRKGIGEDLVAGIAAGNGAFETLFQTIERGRKSATDTLADVLRPLMGGDGSSAELRQVEATAKEQDKVQKAIEANREAVKRAREEIGGLRSEAAVALAELLDPAEAAEMGFGRTADAQVKRLRALGAGLTPEQRRDMGFDDAEIDIRRRQALQVMRDKSAREDAAARAREEEQKEAGAAREMLARTREQNELALMSLRGDEGAARLKRVELDYARQLADVERQQALSVEEKAAAASLLNEQKRMALELTREEIERDSRGTPEGPRTARTLGAGFANVGAGLRGAILGSGAGAEREATKTANNTAQTVNELKMLRQELVRGTRGAVFAP